MQYKPGQCKPLHYPRPNSCTRGKSDEFQPLVLLALTPFSPLFIVSESCNKRNYPEVIARGRSRLELT